FGGVVTNGAVRNVREVRSLEFQLFAGNLSVSHAYAHVFDFGGPVQIRQMAVRPGDLIHGDREGVQTVPLEIASQISRVARTMIEHEGEIIGLCRSPDFSIEKLRAAVGALAAKRKSSKE